MTANQYPVVSRQGLVLVKGTGIIANTTLLASGAYDNGVEVIECQIFGEDAVCSVTLEAVGGDQAFGVQGANVATLRWPCFVRNNPANAFRFTRAAGTYGYMIVYRVL